MKLTISFLSRCFPTSQKSQDKNLNILRMKRAFEVKWKVFFIIFKGLWVSKNSFKPESVLLNKYEKCFLYHLKSPFRCKIFKFLCFQLLLYFFPVSHWLRGWFKINLKVYDFSICLNKNLMTHFVWYLEMEKRYYIETCSNIFMENSCRSYAPKASPVPFLNFGK